MRSYLLAAAALSAFCLAAPAAAEDKTPCGAGLVCASNPQTVMAAMEKAKLAPKLDKDTDGDPMISSEESTYNFDVFFYGCKEHKNCDSLRLQSDFEKAPENTAEFANKWNKKKRFLQAFVRDNGEFGVAYDVATIGGLTPANFADILDWWNSQLDELGTFFQEEIPSMKAK
ncbi:YbjN domain-containing protein [Sphingomonas sp. HF-S4]|uniref:YbjN domain-containing protein n=1 Tax=Sphingomonas agrestis TaxID=3080540 RepID=A0ABU3Y4E8_9SPHN|nr:YbjN domain-containing protein [Sphingomonas sp. HF-S4]MDV3456280.1 YbjN domain-containing protein [Sphingomonas sp. HF-S4]